MLTELKNALPLAKSRTRSTMELLLFNDRIKTYMLKDILRCIF